ncbi:MAG: hypothetical protein IJD51_00610 [Clostridia bacterium]|nr:hypothetical protein [Clostridia bacterium]
MTECIRQRRRCEGGDTYIYELIYNTDTVTTTVGIPVYSLRVRMECGRTGKVTEAHTGGIFADERKAERFFDKLCDNLATPIDLAYVVEDELG